MFFHIWVKIQYLFYVYIFCFLNWFCYCKFICMIYLYIDLHLSRVTEYLSFGVFYTLLLVFVVRYFLVNFTACLNEKLKVFYKINIKRPPLGGLSQSYSILII